MRKCILILMVTVMSIMMAVPATAQDDIVFGIQRETSKLYEINLTTLAQTELTTTPITGSSVQPNGLAYDTDNSRLYYTTYNDDLNAELYFYDLVADAHTKAGDLVGQIACADFYGGYYYYIAGGKDGPTDDLYAVSFNPGGTVNSISSPVDISGNTHEWTFGGDIAIYDDVLYGFGKCGEHDTYEFFSYDGTFNLINDNVPQVYPFSLQLAFSEDGTLYGHDADDSAITPGLFYTVDYLGTGDPTLVPGSSGLLFTDLSSGPRYSEPELYSICGTKYELIVDEYDELLEERYGVGWTINLWKNDGGWAQIDSTTTDDNGDYCFDDLPAGVYAVEEVLKEGWTQVYPDESMNWVHEITLTNDNSMGNDFYNKKMLTYYEETAYALGDECFLDLGFKNWGWTSGPLAQGSYTFEVYAGAGQCDTEKGIYVGDVTITYYGTSPSIDYYILPGFEIVEEHLYIGSGPVPLNKKGKETVSPGQYYVETGLTSFYIIYHAVVGWYE